KHFMGSMTLSYNITSWLFIQERIGVDTFTDQQEHQWNVGVVERPVGRVVNNSQTRSEITSDLTLNFDDTFNDDWTVYGLIGNSINARHGTFVGVTGNQLSVPDFFDPSNASSINAGYNTFKHRIV